MEDCLLIVQQIIGGVYEDINREIGDLKTLIQTQSVMPQVITEDQKQNAKKAFYNAMGCDEHFLKRLLKYVNKADNTVIDYTNFYMYVPVFVASVVLVWAVVAMAVISWVVGLAVTLFLFYVLYASSIFYRYNASNDLDTLNHNFVKNDIIKYKKRLPYAVSEMMNALSN